MVENEAEVQVVNKETARSWRSGSEEGTLEAPMLVQRGVASAVRGVKTPCKMEGHCHNGRCVLTRAARS